VEAKKAIQFFIKNKIFTKMKDEKENERKRKRKDEN
jgi:hypothetical protein